MPPGGSARRSRTGASHRRLDYRRAARLPGGDLHRRFRGIITGLDAGRAIACGASLAGVAYGALKAYDVRGFEGVCQYLSACIVELEGRDAALRRPGPHSVAAGSRVYTTGFANGSMPPDCSMAR